MCSGADNAAPLVVEIRMIYPLAAEQSRQVQNVVKHEKHHQDEVRPQAEQ